MMKVLIASDKFKGTLSAHEVCEAISKGIKKNNEVEIEIQALADGGDGSLEIISQFLNLEKQLIQTVDPLGRKIKTFYLTSHDSAFIELAHASGIALLPKEDRNPMKTSTYGTGLMIKDAINKGFKKVFLFLGGSATNDAGTGIASALGWKFQDKHKRELYVNGGNLVDIHIIESPSDSITEDIEIVLLCDVTNPLYGPHGSAYIYAAQKGANSQEIEFLDNGLKNIHAVLLKESGIDTNRIPGVGSAGGIGASLIALCNAKIQIGFEMISNLTNLEDKIRNADIVISGEGKLDSQSVKGKVIYGVSKLCKKHEKPLIVFAGQNELTASEIENLAVKNAYAIMDHAKDIEDALSNGKFYLEKIAGKLNLYQFKVRVR